MKMLAVCALLALGIAAGVQAVDDRCAAAMSVQQEVAAMSVQQEVATVGAMAMEKRLLRMVSRINERAGIAAASEDQAATLPYGTPQEFDFDTPLGSGKWSIARTEGGKLFFTAKVQFKHEVALDDFVLGTELDSPLAGYPATYQRVATLTNRVLGAGVELELQGDKPYFNCPVMNYAIAVHVSKEAPAGLGEAIPHDTSMFDGVGQSMTYYKKIANRAGKVFSPGFWWTFVIRERNDFATNTLGLARWLNLDAFTNSQPMQYMLKDKSTDEYLLSVDLWTAFKAESFAKKHCTGK